LLAIVQQRAAGIPVVRAYRLCHGGNRQVVLLQRSRIDIHLVLLDQPAERYDVGDARHLQQSRRDDPVLDLAELPLAERRRSPEGIAIELADRRRQRTQRGLCVGWQWRIAKFFEHHLPREVVVGAVRERQLDDGQSENRA
jgi:hypothetical protein